MAASAFGDDSEFVAVTFPFNETLHAFFKADGIPKWDAAGKAWVIPRADWEELSDEGIGDRLRRMTGHEWADVIKALEVLQGAVVEPRDAMPKYKFAGFGPRGTRRFSQVA